MRIVRRNISYNWACSILEANHYNIAKVKSNPRIGMMIFFDKSGRKVARYTEKYGRLEVI
jgi:hypothetical protein